MIADYLGTVNGAPSSFGVHRLAHLDKERINVERVGVVWSVFIEHERADQDMCGRIRC